MHWQTNIVKPASFTLTEQRSLRMIPQSKMSPLGYFLLFFNVDLCDSIIEMTNVYALQLVEEKTTAKKMKPNSRMRTWKPLDRLELFAFVALQLLMGVKQLPEIQSYWSTDPKLQSPIFGKTMSRNRFQGILRCIHFVDNKKDFVNAESDRLWKVRPLLNHFNSVMQLYTPGPNLAIDEQNVLWRGRLLFRQYLPGKRHKYGIKLYLICESGTGIALK